MNEAQRIEQLKLYRTDPWAFLSDCVFTLDQADKNNPIKAFPQFPYLKLYCRIWQQENMIAVPKSRRMFMSWMNIALYTWDTLFHIGRSNGFVSKKEDDADDLIRRAKFIIDNIPTDKIPKEFLPRHDYTYAKLKFPETNSIIQGFPQGADQLRQFTFSGLLADELAFWENAEEMYSSSIPTLEGGGRFTGISSPAPGFFKRLVFDQLDLTGGKIQSQHEERKSMNRFPLEGVEVWKNPKNKFCVFQLHYSANEAKKAPEYREQVKNAMPIRKYMQEYELQWESYAGTPVYPDFKKSTHGTQEVLLPELGLPLLRGWDFGLTPACVVAQYVGTQLRVLKEFTAINQGAEQFSDYVLAQIALLWPKWAHNRTFWKDFIDPAGRNRDQTDMGTCAGVLAKKGMEPIAGPIDWETRRSSVEYFLTQMNKGVPNFQIVLSECPTLVRGFEGGYRYDEKAIDLEPAKVRPIKDEHSHPHDALQYLCGKVRQMMRPRTSGGIPTPSYWMRREDEGGKSRPLYNDVSGNRATG